MEAIRDLEPLLKTLLTPGQHKGYNNCCMDLTRHSKNVIKNLSKNSRIQQNLGGWSMDHSSHVCNISLKSAAN